MVDALRASSSITVALNNFDEILPCFSTEMAFELSEKYNGITAGERSGKKIKGFDIGNSPQKIEDYNIPKNKSKILILTTSNGTRILENMNSKVVLIGSLINAKAVGVESVKLGNNHIDVVMAGYKGNFALEDFLASGEILYQICKNLKEYEITDLAKAAILASRDYKNLKEGFYESNSGKKLRKMGYEEDIDFCILKNISDNVGIYKDNCIKKIIR